MAKLASPLTNEGKAPMTERIEARGSLSPAAAAEARPLPPVWLMGFGNVPLGAAGAVILVTTPQLLAANHVPEPKIAAITSIALIPMVVGFPLAPVLDWRLPRRSYAIAFTISAAVCQYAALLFIHDLAILTTLLFLSFLSVALVVASVGGWFGNLLADEKKSALGAWLTVGNIGAGGLVASVAIDLMRGLPAGLGAAALSLPFLAVLPLFLWTRCPPADHHLAAESFRAFARDVLALLRRRSVLWTLPLFLAPSASFALTNTLGGLGHDFATPEGLVALLGGAGATIAGVSASLLIQALAKPVPPRPLYLAVGVVGALFTLSLILMARTPTVFGLAMLGENAFQAAAFSVANIIILRTMGHDNPLAATQFGLLSAAYAVPLVYMQILDGSAYGHGGVNGSFFVDAAVSGAACVALAIVLRVCRRRIPTI